MSESQRSQSLSTEPELWITTQSLNLPQGAAHHIKIVVFLHLIILNFKNVSTQLLLYLASNQLFGTVCQLTIGLDVGKTNQFFHIAVAIAFSNNTVQIYIHLYWQTQPHNTNKK